MVHSQLPVAAPLCLLCALLLLPSATMIPGGLSPRSVSDPDVQKAAAFAMQEYNVLSANANYYKELRFVEAQSQVVAGVKYYLTIELGETKCTKTAGEPKVYKEIQKCEFSPKAQQEKVTCHFQVWSRPWLEKMELRKMSCN